jgi:AAHS family 4-hydroxybenzoate transporter-like MFS transporter
MSQTIDVSRLIEEQKVGRFAIILIAWTSLVMMADGFDMGALGFAAPALVREWGINRGALGPVFGAGVFGIMIGSILFGYVGDWLGRKKAILIGAFIFGGLTLATAWATTLDQLLVLRLLAGIGIGGAVPNAFVLITEFAPKRMRATWVTIMFTGYTIGTGLGGIVSAWLIPHLGWHVIFVIGGIAPIVLSIGMYYAVPESVRFSVLRQTNRAEVARVAAQLKPGLVVAPDAKFTMSDEQPHGHAGSNASFGRLFEGKLRFITPVLWLVYIANSMALFFMINWLPMLIEAVGVAPNRAALLSTMFSVGGTIGGLVLMRFVDKYGALVITALPLIGCPAVALLGSGMPETALIVAVFTVGFCVTGTQFGLNAVASIVYPTAFRSKGTGTAIGIAKIGSISGPMIGGVLLSAHLPISELFHIAAIPVAIVVVLAFALGRLYRHGPGVAQEKETAPAAKDLGRANAGSN